MTHRTAEAFDCLGMKPGHDLRALECEVAQPSCTAVLRGAAPHETRQILSREALDWRKMMSLEPFHVIYVAYT